MLGLTVRCTKKRRESFYWFLGQLELKGALGNPQHLKMTWPKRGLPSLESAQQQWSPMSKVAVSLFQPFPVPAVCVKLPVWAHRSLRCLVPNSRGQLRCWPHWTAAARGLNSTASWPWQRRELEPKIHWKSSLDASACEPCEESCPIAT